jgi:hypothetical protein
MMRSRSRWNSLREPAPLPHGDAPAFRRVRRVRGQVGVEVDHRIAGLQRGQQQFARRAGDARAAQRFEQDELDRPALVLLVDFHQLDPALRAEVGRHHRQAGGLQARTRATLASSTRPRRRDRSAAITMPQPTASPCSQAP